MLRNSSAASGNISEVSCQANRMRSALSSIGSITFIIVKTGEYQ
jgi:hypothetical protein